MFYFTCLEGSGRQNHSYFTCLEGSGRLNFSYFTCLEGSGMFNLSYFTCPGGSGEVRPLTNLNEPKIPGGSAKENKHSRIGGPRLGWLAGWLAEVWMFGCLEKFGCFGCSDIGMFGDSEGL